MKNLWIMFLMLMSATVFAGNGTGSIGVGDEAEMTDVKMQDVSGKQVSLSDAKMENGVLVMFSCNTCPFVKQWEGRYPQIKEWADNNKVGMIVLNSNYQKRDNGDSYEDMKKQASEKGYDFYYVVDKESRIANAFGGQTTPHVFLFDKNMELVYKGAIDDNPQSASDVKNAYLKDALVSLGHGEPIAVSETKPVGCSIKRKIEM